MAKPAGTSSCAKDPARSHKSAALILGVVLCILQLLFMIVPVSLVLGLVGGLVVAAVAALAVESYLVHGGTPDASERRGTDARRRAGKTRAVGGRLQGPRSSLAEGAKRPASFRLSHLSSASDLAFFRLPVAAPPREAPPATQELQTLNVQWLSGRSTGVQVCGEASVRELRQKVAGICSAPARRVRLLHGTSVLDDSTRAGDLDGVLQCVIVDGWQAVSAACDHTLRVWDLLSGACSGKLTGHKDRVSSVCADFASQRAVSGSWDSTLRVWDLEGVCCLGVLEGHLDGVTAVTADFSTGAAVSASWDATIRVWDLGGLECLAVLTGHLDRVISVDVEFDLGRVLSRGSDGVLKVWSLPGGCRATIDGHAGWLTATCADLREQRALTAAFDGSLKLWDLEGGALVGHLSGPRAAANAVCADFSRRQAVTGSVDGLRIWDLTRLSCTVFLDSCKEAIHSLAVDFDGMRAVAGSVGGKVQLWDLDGRTEVCTHVRHSSLVCAISADFARQRAVSCSTDGTLSAFDLARLEPLGGGVMAGHSQAVTALCAE